MSLYSKNPGPWRIAKNGALPAFNYSTAPMAKPTGGKVDKADMTGKTGNRRKRYQPTKLGKNARKRANRRHGKASF